ncbi:ADAM-TS Spacer 1 [Necator americanus]|uniref:ADAM-TS Spacer 1 n=1 Tax=Necator americanus TaxID=51031 RepID=W2T6Y2_NECAM|nr:ADAM-TS Spacer 1 [Necator americanus]ETN76921.1 ADAM-TS Spacer 1 [Necator americanus]
MCERELLVALRASNGEFLLNGHYQVSVFRQQIPIQDVILEYSGSDNVVERINGTGPIRVRLLGVQQRATTTGELVISGVLVTEYAKVHRIRKSFASTHPIIDKQVNACALRDGPKRIRECAISNA